MKKLRKFLLYAVPVLVAALVAAITLTIGWRPFIGPRTRPTTSRQFERTPERLARGRYLVRGLVGCEICHSPKDWNTHGAPMLPGMELAGQEMPVAGLPGRVVASNLTPDPETGAANWTDDELARAIREGIGPGGRALFPMMPYASYRQISDEDLAAVVVYLRSVPAVRHPLPRSEIKFPVNYLIRDAPQPVSAPVQGPNPQSDPVERGKYLATLGCGCHIPTDRGQALPGMAYAGGERLTGPWGDVTAANITPDASGIGYYDVALFLEVVRSGFVKARKLSSIMPFGELKELNDDDLKAIFSYLQTLPPVKHRVDNSLPPTYCKLCRQKHGAGDQN